VEIFSFLREKSRPNYIGLPVSNACYAAMDLWVNWKVKTPQFTQPLLGIEKNFFFFIFSQLLTKKMSSIFPLSMYILAQPKFEK
jgi:hypothetical protein